MSVLLSTNKTCATACHVITLTHCAEWKRKAGKNKKKKQHTQLRLQLHLQITLGKNTQTFECQ